MQRTPGLTRYRRELADAAGGFPRRVSVVLYVCVPPGPDIRPMLHHLRQFAEARDWGVTAAAFDRAPLSSPLESRAGWRWAQDLILTRLAEGIVTGSEAMCGHEPLARADVRAWLHQHHAFLTEGMGPGRLALDGIG